VRGHDEYATRRRRSAWLSLAAAGLTALILAWAVLANGDRTRSWLAWIVTISLPVIVLSTGAALQYWRGRSAGAGAAAAAAYWVMLVVFNLEAATLYLFGGLLQTAAWWISRPRKHQGQATADAVHNAP
jgi:hypothetical protein